MPELSGDGRYTSPEAAANGVPGAVRGDVISRA